MKIKKTFRLFLLVIFGFLLATNCFAKTYLQKDNLFSLSVPDGYEWIEQFQNIRIMGSQEKSTIIIRFQPHSTRGYGRDEIKYMLQRGTQNMIAVAREQEGGIDFKEMERLIDGIDAIQADFLMLKKREIIYSSFISLFNKGYLFTISIESSLESERSKLKDIIETLKF